MGDHGVERVERRHLSVGPDATDARVAEGQPNAARRRRARGGGMPRFERVRERRLIVGVREEDGLDLAHPRSRDGDGEGPRAQDERADQGDDGDPCADPIGHEHDAPVGVADEDLCVVDAVEPQAAQAFDRQAAAKRVGQRPVHLPGREPPARRGVREDQRAGDGDDNKEDDAREGLRRDREDAPGK